MALVAGLILGAMALYLIGYPIITDEEMDALDYKDRITALEEDKELEKEVIFSELSELEFDYQMNKLSAKDYRELKRRLQELAVEVLEENGG